MLEKQTIDPLFQLESFQFGQLKLEDNQPGGWTVGRAPGSVSALYLSALWAKATRPLLLVVKDQNAMYRWVDDLEFFTEYFNLPNQDRILPLPHPETLPYEIRDTDTAVQTERLSTLKTMLLPTRNKPWLVVMPVRALLRRFAPFAYWRKKARRLRTGEQADRDDLVSWLSTEGYEFRELVCGPGEYSVRGGILDVFPLHSPHPFRVEFFGDEIDSIRIFDLVSQRSSHKVDSELLLPGHEEHLAHEALEKFGALPSLVESLDTHTRIILNEPEELAVEAERFDVLTVKMFREVGKMGEEVLGDEDYLPPISPEQRYIPWDNLLEQIEQTPHGILTPFQKPDDAEGLDLEAYPVDLPPGPHKGKIEHLVHRAEENRTVWIVCDNEGQRHRLEEMIRPEGSQKTMPESLEILVGGLHDGFSLPDLGWLWTTDRQIFGRYRRIRHRIAKGVSVPILDLVELKPGDFVVHEEQGISRYRGLKRLTIEEREGEFLVLEFADNDTLYVPIDQIERVSRYIGSTAVPPKLSKLGGKSWQTAKNKARQAIEDMAGELLELYASREVAGGFGFQPDTPWQHEFEASFLFDETQDQLRSIEEVKRDMESSRPMDRLICGDVGFGKTEVALRAAFKAVMDGKQAAVLAPTTVLTEQHFQTFSERMADYPVTVEALSRFRTPAEQKSTLALLAEGKIDIIVGTHRLLQKDVAFRDLGLVIVDEEQRFGVRHKEKLKQMKTQVDCMTLTATPIPRTMYMSLNGVRDMSIVNTPPKDRQPIQTYVCDWSHEVIESAILRELARGGQIYFVHNRVQSIGGIARILEEIVPEARVAVGHGQMPEKQLAKVMRDFVDRKYDILLATTIIESGLDIPSVNTIIINRADAFGLADLYQLRGRVGRDRHRAYCYLMVPSKGALSRVAKQRLLALQEFNQLGSGFQLAIRDMEIRGTGNLLGKQQHGHIAAIGFDLYSKLLADTVDHLTGRARETYPEPQLEMEVPGSKSGGRGEIPTEYVPSARLRMSLYKKLAQVRNHQELDEFEKELNDLYGAPPPVTRRLLATQRLWLIAWQVGIDKLRIGAGQATLRYCEEAAKKHFSPEIVMELNSMVSGQLTVSIREGVVLTLKSPDGAASDGAGLLPDIQKILKHIGRTAGVAEEEIGALTE